MLKKHIFHKSIHKKTSPFKRKLNWIPASRDDYTKVSFFTCVEQELEFISNPRLKICSNLVREEQAALTDLKNKQPLIINYFINVEVFSSWTQETTSQKPTHFFKTTIRTNYSPTNQEMQQHMMLVLSYTICILFQTHKRHGVMKFVLCSTNTHTPLFYGVSKRYKPNFSLHSIILRCDHYTGRLSLCITYFI